mmetsp:Transcript_19015/g.39889  ORF Transcript_19015/g.39889 Transcript_19015/m.39889 type:complete len:373 (-) Transcript_19015:127-1245(-)
MSSFPPNQNPSESKNIAAEPDGNDDAPPNQNNNHQLAAKEGKRRRRSGIGRGSKKRKQKQQLLGATVATFPGMRDHNAVGVAFEAEGGGEATAHGIQMDSKIIQKKEKKSMQNKLYYEKQKTVKKDEVINNLEEQLEVHEENEPLFEDLLQQHSKAAAAAQADANAALDRLYKIKQRHTTYHLKRQNTLQQVKKSTKKQAEANEKRHQQELLQQRLQHIQECRGLKKTVVILKSQLENIDKDAWKASALVEEHHEKVLKQTTTNLEKEIMKSSREHNKEVAQLQAQLQSTVYLQSRDARKVEVALQGQLEKAVAQKEEAYAENDSTVWEAVRKTKAKERNHYATVVEGEKAKVAMLQSSLDDACKVITSLLH